MSDETTTAPILTDAAEPTLEQVVSQVFRENAPAAPAEAAEPAAPAVEPAKDPVAERASTRILAAQRAEMRAAKVRAEIAAQRAEVDSQRAEVAEHLKTAEAIKAAKLSPSKALELLGMDAKTFLESLATEHEPDAVARRAVEGTQTELQKLQSEIAAMKAERAAEVQQRIVAQRRQTTQQGGEVFLDYVAANAAQYPNLVDAMTPDEIVNEGFAALDEVIGKDARGNPVTRLQAFQAEHGKPPDDSEIAEFLEYRATPRAQARSVWRERIGKSAPQPPSQGVPSGDVRATQMDRGPSPRTLTSRAASERAAATPEWTQEAADAESIRILNAALKTG